MTSLVLVVRGRHAVARGVLAVGASTAAASAVSTAAAPSGTTSSLRQQLRLEEAAVVYTPQAYDEAVLVLKVHSQTHKTH